MGTKPPRNQGLVADSVLHARRSKMHRACFFTVESSGSLAAWWMTSVAASFWLNLHHHHCHHNLHHSWPPGSERAKGGPALDQISSKSPSDFSVSVDLRTSGTGRIYPVPNMEWLGFEPPAADFFTPRIAAIRPSKFLSHQSITDVSGWVPPRRQHRRHRSWGPMVHKGDHCLCQNVPNHCWNCSKFWVVGHFWFKIITDLRKRPWKSDSISHPILVPKQAKPMELPFANLWKFNSVLWKITMKKGVYRDLSS